MISSRLENNNGEGNGITYMWNIGGGGHRWRRMESSCRWNGDLLELSGGGGVDLFLRREKERGAEEGVLVEKKMAWWDEILIVSALDLRCIMGIWCAARTGYEGWLEHCLERRFRRAIMTGASFGAKRIYYSETGRHVLTPFFDTCQDRRLNGKSCWFGR